MILRGSSANLSANVVVEPEIAAMKGNGGLMKIRMIHRSGATSEVYLHGATVTSYKPPDGREMLFVSPSAIFDGKKAIRGGIPIVFPQFNQPDKRMPSHGFARVMTWQFDPALSSIRPDGMVQVVLRLKQSPGTLEVFPHDFELEYAIRLTAGRLQCALTVVNDHLKEWEFQCLLHTYLNVEDISAVAVKGLRNCTYYDKVTDSDNNVDKDEEVRFNGYTDRVYKAGTGALLSLVAAEVCCFGTPYVFIYSCLGSVAFCVLPSGLPSLASVSSKCLAMARGPKSRQSDRTG